MANQTIHMQSLKQIIRLKSKGKSNRVIATLLDIDRKTINKYVHLIVAAGLPFEDLLKMDDGDLDTLFLKQAQDNESEKLKVLYSMFPQCEKELTQPGVSQYRLWMEYKEEYPNGFTYSYFNRKFGEWMEAKNIYVPIEHKAGDKIFIDFAGTKFHLLDRETGKKNPVEVFVATLGASMYTYVEAIPSQKKEDFIRAIENAFIFIGGVTQSIVPDNLKSAVLKSDRYEPLINPTLEDFAEHYNTTVIPARAKKPKDKALVESAVKIVYARIFAPLRKREFYTLAELNRAILEQLEKYNSIKLTARPYSRKDLFLEIEKSQLQPLPCDLYELKNFEHTTVVKNCHVQLKADKHYYSVPYSYVSKRVKLIYTQGRVEIFYKYQRIALHTRDTTPYRYSTNSDHMPSHKKVISDWNPDKFISWANSIGENTEELVKTIIQSRLHPEQAYKSCMGILQLAKRVGNTRLNNACKRAIYYQSYRYITVKNILDKEMENLPIQEEDPQTLIPSHENIRGKDYYQ